MLGNRTISHLSTGWTLWFLFFLQMGLFLVSLEYFFFPLFFFRLKEMPRTCQVYCMKVITEPWRKYLNNALVMCCSDNFSFQSKINYCFIKKMSSCLFSFIPPSPLFVNRKSTHDIFITFSKQQDWLIRFVKSGGCSDCESIHCLSQNIILSN